MQLILHKNAPWTDLHIETGSGERRPCRMARSGATEVFVLGYPYDGASGTRLDPAGILESYIADGASLTGNLEGSFAILILDRAAEKCIVIVDPYKIYTLFYGRTDDGLLVISDSVGDIARTRGSIGPDRAGILEFTSFGFILGDRTVIDGIRSFRAASVHTIGGDLILESRPYWDISGEGPSAAPSPNPPGEKEVADAFEEHMSKGLSTGGRISMPLTGGLDSRTVLATCMNDTDRLHCYTHGRRDSDDVKISSRISERFGVPWDFYEVGDAIAKDIPALAGAMTGPCNGLLNVVMSSHFLPSYEKESAHGDIFFSGIGGELFRSYYMSAAAAAARSTKEFGDALRQRISIQAQAGVFADMSDADVICRLDDSIMGEISRYGTEDRQLLSERFYLENRVGNFTALSMRLVGEHFDIFNPFLERKMLNIAAALPANLKRGMGIQKMIIERSSPELGRILMDRARPLSSGGGAAGISQAWQRAIVLARIYSNKLTGRQLFNFSFTDYDSWLKEYHRDYVLDLLDHDSMMTKDLYDRDDLDRLKTRFFGTRSGLCSFMTNIMSTELFFRHLSGD